MVLKSKIHANQIISDDNVSRFNAEAEENAPDEQVLKDSQQEFQLDLIAEIFEFYGFLHSLNRILDVYYKNRTVIEGPIEATFLPIKDCITNFLKVANGFNAQLKQLSVNEGLAEDSAVIQERFRKAIVYFNTETETKILEPLKTFAFTTDNQAVGADITKQLDDFEDLLTIKVLYFKGMVSGFNTTRFLELRAKSVFSGKEKPKKQRKTVINGTSNVELFETLRLLRNDIAEEQDLIHYQIFSQKTLYEMCETLPTTKQELLEVNGMGKRRVGKYGDAILKVIRDYCKAHDIETSPDIEFFEAPKPKQKGILRRSL
ncbi:ATP-dependent DNA helicase RecQ [Jejuia pallidilutea]|uniref:ATP-dependent DNA helicase RecQ n=1 Tax=Jejuia pallidilutea TaxID=504487 RepID=A0A090WMG0_9FLAO|nr:ATP-dependent DNA helicase RecQ [Jejuia pallidilutea]